MKRLLALFLAVLFLVSLAACGGSNSGKTDNTSEPAKADTTITTPYADLRVTKDFYDHTDTKVESEDPYVLGFYTKEGTELFLLHFDDETDNILGTLKLKDKNVVIYTELAKLDSKDSNYDRDCIYQEEVNIIGESLDEDYDFVPNQIASEDDVVTYDIETSVVTLKYPKRWEDKVETEVTDNKVKFSCDGTPLFDILFTDDEGFPLGTYNNTPVNVVYYDVDKDEYLEMIDDVNVILQNLMKEKDFAAHVN